MRTRNHYDIQRTKHGGAYLEGCPRKRIRRAHAHPTTGYSDRPAGRGYSRNRPDRHGQDGGVRPAPLAETDRGTVPRTGTVGRRGRDRSAPARAERKVAREKRPPCYSVPRSDPHAGARPSDRRVVRRLRKVYGPEARDDFRGSQAGTSDGQAPPGRRYSDRHSRTSARPDRSGRGRTREPVAFRAGRGGPDARHGLYRRYQALVAVASGPAPDASFLGHHAPGYRGSVGLRLVRSGTGRGNARFFHRR